MGIKNKGVDHACLEEKVLVSFACHVPNVLLLPNLSGLA